MGIQGHTYNGRGSITPQKGDVNSISKLDFLLQSQLFGQIFDTYISMCDSLDLD